MNYLAHGFRFVDRPWFLAGTAVPDWLAACDRRARVRRERLPADDALADGMRQHLDDDDRFHRTEAFQRAESDLTELFRSTNTHRCWFFGHICVELLLDGWLCERHPTLLHDYFEALSDVDPAELVARVSPWLTRPPERLDETRTRIPAGACCAVVVGSVGQPRGSDDMRASWTLWDPEERVVEFRRTEYPAMEAALNILEAGLPAHSALRLLDEEQRKDLLVMASKGDEE